MTADAELRRLRERLAEVPLRAVACSGGVDSLLLATVAHRADPAGTVVVHSVTPAVPAAATARVLEAAAREGWTLRTVRSGEFDDPRYLANPRDRCYVCKSHLYDAMGELVDRVGGTHVLLSGANTDDLGEYRPGLRAAAERGVRHPYVEAGIGKAGIRAVAASLGLDCADLPAAPCLASRLYTGTPVTPLRLRAVEVGEELVTRLTGIRVVRCRLRDDEVRIEVRDADRSLVDDAVVAAVLAAMRAVDPGVRDAALDGEAYRPGRAFELTPVGR
ncbi:ATPase [Blastococcus sp. URHD0036]|uniref:ATPase n=1 Tax=Blastococcus sp. URHD0036 TaxID=1380356 RepID=UPI00068E5899|nr:ATPase [Blastococcus sp. URHD0036]